MKAAETECIEQEMENQEIFRYTKNEAEKYLDSLTHHRNKLSACTETVTKKYESLNQWLSNIKSQEAPNPEEVLIPVDGLTLQLVKLQAESLAADDLLYLLTHALASRDNHSADLSFVLPQYRKICKEQFICKKKAERVSKMLAEGL